MKTRRKRRHLSSTEEAALVEQIAAEKLEALMKVVDFSPLYGAPRWIVDLILADARPLLGKHPRRWQPREIARLQETVNTLPIRLILAAHTEPPLV